MRAALLLIAGLFGLMPIDEAAAQPGHAPERYFIDFRARRGDFLGHTFIVYGRVDAHGRPLELYRAGLYPREEFDESLLLAVVPVPGAVKVDADDLTKPLTAVYRRSLTADEYARVKVTVERLRATKAVWHIALYNCNDFVAQVAHGLGLATPPSFQLPDAFVRGLRMMNRR